jgi:hypothetical protein
MSHASLDKLHRFRLLTLFLFDLRLVQQEVSAHITAFRRADSRAVVERQKIDCRLARPKRSFCGPAPMSAQQETKDRIAKRIVLVADHHMRGLGDVAVIRVRH